MLDKIKGAVEHADHFYVDDGSGAPFRVAKAALSPAMVDRVRQMYCGGPVQRMAFGGVSGFTDEPAPDTVASMPTDLAGTPTEPSITPPVELTTPPATPPVEPAPTVEVTPTVEVAPPVETPVAPVTPVEVAPTPPPVKPPQPPGIAPAPAPAPAPAAAPFVPTIPAATVTAAAPEPAKPAEVNIAAQLEKAAQGYLPAGATAADLAAVKPLAEARQAREGAAEKERLAAVEIARQAAIERERDRVAAEQEGAELTSIARKHEEAKQAAVADLNVKAAAYRDTEKARVEAGQLWSNMNGWQTALAGFSMLLGGAVSGVTGRSNEAADVIESAINKNIEEQRRSIAATRSIRLKEYEAAGATLSQASELLRADMLNLQAAKARSIAAQQTSRSTRDAFTMLAASLDTKRTAAVESALNDMGAAAVSASLAKRAVQKEDLQIKGEVQRQKLAANADRRADAALALDRQKLAVDLAKVAAAQRAAAVQEQATIAGRLGQELSPDQWSRIGDDKEREKYVAITTDKGDRAYRLATSAKDAEELRSLNTAVERGLENAKALGKFIGKDAPTILPGTTAKSESEALQQKIVMAIKNIEDLGALTQADMGLVAPLIPDPQSWTSTSGQEAAQLKQLTDSFRLLRKLAMKNKLALSADEKTAIENEVRSEIGAPLVGSPDAPAAGAAPAAVAPSAASRQVGVDAQGNPVFSGAPAEVPGFGSLIGGLVGKATSGLEAQQREAEKKRIAEWKRGR